MTDIVTTSWSEVDASNNQFPPEGWPAGMLPNAVEPTARMNMGAVKRFWNRVNPVYVTTLGATTDTFVVSPTQAITGYGLFEAWELRPHANNLSTSPTLSISGLPAQPIKKYVASSITSLAAGDFSANRAQRVYWDGAEFILGVSQNSGVLGVAGGGTGSNLSATGGASQVLKQTSVGGAITVGQLAASDLSNGTTGSGAVALATNAALITPALGTPTAGVLSACTGLPLTTGVTGVLAAANGGFPTGASTNATTTPTANGGTFTSVTAVWQYYLINKIMIFQVTITVTTNGTASGFIIVPLPNSITAKYANAGGGAESANTGKACRWEIAGGGQTALTNVSFYDNTYPGGTSGNTISLNGWLETT